MNSHAVILLNVIPGLVFVVLAFTCFCMRGKTVRLLAFLFGALGVKAFSTTALIVMGHYDLVSINVELRCFLLGTPIIDILGSFPFGYGLLKKVITKNE